MSSSQATPDATGSLTTVTTAVVPDARQFEFYRDGVMRRFVPSAIDPGASSFRGRMRRIVGLGVELVEHSSDAVLAERTAERVRRDDCDDITLDLMRHCNEGTSILQNGERTLRSGEFCIIDYGQPVSVRRSRHMAHGIVLSRARVREAIGGDIAMLAGQALPYRGLAAVLRRHLVTTFDRVGEMAAADRAAAAAAAGELMLALLQARTDTPVDDERFAAGFYRAALTVIDWQCTDPDLTPARVAAVLGCSRASLYRAFARHDETVAQAIWIARLARARQMLVQGPNSRPVGEVAWRCGFRDPASFARMFRRVHGFPPSDARAVSKAEAIEK